MLGLSLACIFEKANNASGKAGGVAGVFVGGCSWKRQMICSKLTDEKHYMCNVINT